MLDFIQNLNPIQWVVGVIGAGAIALAIDYIKKNIWVFIFNKKVIISKAEALNKLIEKGKEKSPQTFKQIESDLIEIFEAAIVELKK